jgi:hypothetical protein
MQIALGASSRQGEFSWRTLLAGPGVQESLRRSGKFRRDRVDALAALDFPIAARARRRLAHAAAAATVRWPIVVDRWLISRSLQT